MHQVATLSLQLGLGSVLVHWYRDATSVPFGHLLIDLSPRTDDRLRYCTNSGNIPSKFYVPDNIKHLKDLDDEHTKFLYSPSNPTLFPRMRNSVSKACPREFIRFLSECVVNLLQGNLSEAKKETCPKVQRQNLRTVFKKKQLGRNEEVYFRRKKGIIAHTNNFPLRH